MISRRRTDLPVPGNEDGRRSGKREEGLGKEREGEGDEPADPVKKRLIPSLRTSWRTCCCSAESITLALMLMGTLDVVAVENEGPPEANEASLRRESF